MASTTDTQAGLPGDEFDEVVQQDPSVPAHEGSGDDSATGSAQSLDDEAGQEENRYGETDEQQQ